MIIHLFDIVYHNFFKHGIVVQIQQSYCIVYFENGTRKMFIIDKNNDTKNLTQSPINLTSFIEKKLYLGVYDKNIKEKEFNNIKNISVVPGQILGTYLDYKMNLKLINNHFSSICSCNQNCCFHTYSLLKTYEQTILLQNNQINEIIKLLGKVNNSEGKLVEIITPLYNLIKELPSYSQLCKTLFNTFNRISSFISAYNAICVCIIAQNKEIEFIKQCRDVADYFGYDINNKIVNIKSYFSYYLTNHISKLNMHKFYLLYLVCTNQFNTLFEDMKYRIKQHDLNSFDILIFNFYAELFSKQDGFIEYYLMIKNHSNIHINFQPIFDQLSIEDKKNMILYHPIPELFEYYVPYLNQFSDSEIKECMFNFAHNDSTSTYTFKFLNAIYPHFSNPNTFLDTILKIICNEFDKHCYLSYDSKNFLIDLILKLPHHRYLLEIFNTNTMYALLHKEGDNDE